MESVIANDDIVAELSHRSHPVGGRGTAVALEHFVVEGLWVLDDVKDHVDFDQRGAEQLDGIWIAEDDLGFIDGYLLFLLSR